MLSLLLVLVVVVLWAASWRSFTLLYYDSVAARSSGGSRLRIEARFAAGAALFGYTRVVLESPEGYERLVEQTLRQPVAGVRSWSFKGGPPVPNAVLFDAERGFHADHESISGARSHLSTGYVQSPIWAWAVPFALLPAVRLLAYIRRRRRAATARCENCGYDLRASGDRCPECGNSIPSGSQRTC